MTKKVLLLCGSPHEEGCTRRALREIENVLHEENIQTETFLLGREALYGCSGCGGCRKTGTCVYGDPAYTRLAPLLEEADGYVVGSPVYYAGPNGALCALLDRVFRSMGAKLRGKPACCVVSCRRGGASASFDRLNKYFTINQMPVVPSVYWNSVHGNTPKEVEKDLEGLQVMRTLGRNMAAMLGAEPLNGCREARTPTNFIR